MKESYSFKVIRDQEIEKTVENKDGSKTITKEICPVPVEVVFKSLSRAERTDMERYHHASYSKAIRDGIMTKAMLKKVYDQNGGILSEEEELERKQLISKLTELQSKIQFNELTLKESKSKKEKESLDKEATELFEKFVEIHNKLDFFRQKEEDVFVHCAENVARERTIEWLVCNTFYIKEGDSYKDVFQGKDVDEKSDFYEKMLEEEPKFYASLMEKISTVASLWYMGRASNKEEFDSAFEILFNEE